MQGEINNLSALIEVKENMTIVESLYFMYDGISSITQGLINCSVGKSGLSTEPLVAEIEIRESSTRYNDRPFFQGLTRKPLIIPVQFAFLEPWDDEKLKETTRWLCQTYYKEMYFSDNPNKRYYTIANANPELVHNSLRQGYINIQFRNIDAFNYSPIFLSSLFDLSSNPLTGTNIEFINNGDFPCKPIISFKKIGDGDISIVNLSDGGKELKITSLLNNEDILINNEYGNIQTSIPNTYRYDNHNGVFLDFIRGINQIQCFGNMTIQFKYQFKLL